MAYTKKDPAHLASAFAGAASFFAKWRKTRMKGKRGGTSGRGNKFKGRFQFTDVDEDRIARLARRKQLAAVKNILPDTPAAIWMRVVTQYGQTIVMNADQFDAGGAGKFSSATPHFS